MDAVDKLMNRIKQLATIAAAMVLTSATAVAAEPELVDGIAAIVNSEVITHKELAERVDMAVKQLRGKLGDDPGDPRFIVRVRGQGDRFDGA